MDISEFYRQIQSLDHVHIIFLCAGNICRSPYAEMKFEKLMTESKIHNKAKFKIQSGGFIIQKEVQIHPFTRQILIEEGIPIDRVNEHHPRAMRKHKDDLQQATALIVMTQSQKEVQVPMKYREKTFVLSELVMDGKLVEIPDPALLEDIEEYRQILKQIDGYLQLLIAKFENLNI